MVAHRRLRRIAHRRLRLGDKLPLLYQAYIPTVTCDIMYEWARGAVGD